MESIYLAIVLAPLLAAVAAGLFGKTIGRAGAHWVTIVGVGVSFVLSLVVFKHLVFDGGEAYNGTVYSWAAMGRFSFEVGFLIDRLTVLMMTVVTFVSLCVHVYTIGYMHEDDGYQRFFSYISLFTFSMLMLVMSNNFLQLFFGWEAVGVVSYLLIGFWYKRPTAIFANMKAFLVNRVGDFGFLLGIAALAAATVRMKNTKICPEGSPCMRENAMKLKLTASSMSSMHMSSRITFLRLMKMPATLRLNRMAASTR